MEDVAQPRKVHENFNSTGADVTFQSSDNVIFRIHRRNLEVVSGGFAGPEFVADGEVVQLEEPASVLEVLFQFAYPSESWQDIGDMPPETLIPVSEAAEKFRVFTAMQYCQTQLWRLIQDYSIKDDSYRDIELLSVKLVPILIHAIKHDHPKMIDACALPLCLAKTTLMIHIGLPPAYVIPWCLFHEKCLEIQAFVKISVVKLLQKTVKLHVGVPAPQHRLCLYEVLAGIASMDESQSFEEVKDYCHNFDQILHGHDHQHDDGYLEDSNGVEEECFIFTGFKQVLSEQVEAIEQLSLVSYLKGDYPVY